MFAHALVMVATAAFWYAVCAVFAAQTWIECAVCALAGTASAAAVVVGFGRVEFEARASALRGVHRAVRGR